MNRHSSVAASYRLMVAFLVVAGLVGLGLAAAFMRFYALHEEFLSVNFDSVHGARTLLKAQFFLGQAQKDLEAAAGPGAAERLDEAAHLLSLAGSYGAEGVERNPEVRALLVARVQHLLSNVSRLRQDAAADPTAVPRRAALLAATARKLSDDFGAAELERWAMLSSLNAEMAQRMAVLKWLIGAAGTVFALVMAVLAWSVMRQRKVEEQLRQANALAETIQQSTLDTAPNGIAYLHLASAGGRDIFRVNRKMEEMFGYGTDELIGKSTAVLYPSSTDYLELGGEATPVVARGETYRTERKLKHKNGSLFWCSMAVRAIDAHDLSLGIVWMLEDIDRRKQAEVDLLAAKLAAEQANMAKSRFLAAASHDLRQPLQAIGLFSHTLARMPLEDEQRRIVGQLTCATDAMGELLEAHLDISKLDAGAVKPRLESIDAVAIFHRIESECAPLALAKGLRFMFFMPRRHVVIRTDANLLLAMLRNVVGNAITYTQKGGILIGMRQRSGALAIQVWDTGIGIPAHHLPQVYGEFFQVGNPERERSRGLGLGLSIVKRLAALLGYAVDCRSVLGRGTVFEIGIPETDVFDGDATDSGTSTAPPAGDAADWPELRGRRVVLVEDDLLAASALSEWLRCHGLQVSSFASAAEALASPEILKSAFVVSDFRLPGDMNGLELLDAIQTDGGGPIKGLIVTGDTSAERIDAFAAAPWKVLHKPVAPSTLLAAIAEGFAQG